MGMCRFCSLKKEEYEVVIHNLFRSEPHLQGLGSAPPHWGPAGSSVLPCAPPHWGPAGSSVSPCAPPHWGPASSSVLPCAPPHWGPAGSSVLLCALPIGIRPAAQYCRVPLPPVGRQVFWTIVKTLVKRTSSPTRRYGCAGPTR